MILLSYKQKLDNLPDNVKDYLISDFPMLEIKKSLVLFGIDSQLSRNITKEIGLMYVGDIDIKKLPGIIYQNIKAEEKISYGIAYEINRKIFSKFPYLFKNAVSLLQQWEQLKSSPIKSENDAWNQILHSEPWISEMEKEREAEERNESEQFQQKMDNLVRMPISEALETFPDLGEKPLSSNSIRLKLFPGPARPSIKNWITDYHNVLGAGRHEMMQRGNYLYHSENAKRITPGERQKLAVILKSLDENEPVTIDTGSQEVVFEQPEANQPRPAATNVEPRSIENISPPQSGNFIDYADEDTGEEETEEEKKVASDSGSYHFSYPQKMPVERQAAPSHQYAPQRVVAEKKETPTPALPPKPLPARKMPPRSEWQAPIEKAPENQERPEETFVLPAKPKPSIEAATPSPAPPPPPPPAKEIPPKPPVDLSSQPPKKFFRSFRISPLSPPDSIGSAASSTINNYKKTEPKINGNTVDLRN